MFIIRLLLQFAEWEMRVLVRAGAHICVFCNIASQGDLEDIASQVAFVEGNPNLSRFSARAFGLLLGQCVCSMLPSYCTT